MEVLPTVSAALLVLLGYINPASWAACIDGGTRFGADFAVFLFLFNLVACLCQYLSMHIGVVSGKNLAQICYVEYDTFNHIFLGIQAEVSIIMSDLAMTLGIANGLHMILRMDLFNAVILTSLDAILYPFSSILMGHSKAIGLLVRLAVLTLVFYALVMLIGVPHTSVSPISVPSKLVGEHVYALMSLLGANLMPHNFYLHSSLVQRFQGSSGGTRARLAYRNFYSIFAIFSGIFLVNYVQMNSAANIFYNSGAVLPTFEDGMSLMEQSSWSLPLAFILLILSSHISNLSWDISVEGRQTILYHLFEIDLPCWLHRATVRILVIAPALYSLYYCGAEGMYQMLISTQIVVALLLPASLVALYRIASSRALMGPNKISPAMDSSMMTSLLAIVGLQLIFLWEMVFGDMGTATISSPYLFLVFVGCVSLCFTFRLFLTPLRSSDGVHGSLTERRENNMVFSEPAPFMETTIMRTHLTPIPEVSTAEESCDSPVGSLEMPSIVPEAVSIPEMTEDRSGIESATSSNLKVDGESVTKNGQEGQTLDQEEGSKKAVQVAPDLVPDSSSRVDGGNGAESLAIRPERATRLQLAAILNEFWGQLFDLYGHLTQKAITKKLDFWFSPNSNSNPPASLAKVDSAMQENLPASTKTYTHVEKVADKIVFPLTEVHFSDNNSQWVAPTWKSRLYPTLALTMPPPGFNVLPTMGSKQRFEQRGVTNNTSFSSGGEKSVDTVVAAVSEVKLLQSMRDCILKLLKLQGSEWLFRRSDGADEHLVHLVAKKERFLYEANLENMKLAKAYNFQHSVAASAGKRNVSNVASLAPHCGGGCVWKADLVFSFGVWCIHRLLELSLVETHPELWGKYTYVLNRLQGVIEPAFFKERTSMVPCFCLETTDQPPERKPTTSPTLLLDIINDIRISLPMKNAMSETAPTKVAFTLGKENLFCVLRRYRRRLSNMPIQTPKRVTRQTSYCGHSD